jgi:hypothetical protein
MGSSFAEALSALMTHRGVSGRGLARQVPCDSALICRYRTGKQAPSANMAHRLDEVLQAGGHLAALAGPGRRAVLAGGAAAGLAALAPGSLERLAWARRHPHRIDQAAVDSLADVLASQIRADNALGAAVMLPPVHAQLTVVENLVKQTSGPIRAALVNVAQQWAQRAAYQHRQIGDAGGDRGRLAQTLEWATEIGDRTMTATVLLNRGESALLAGETGTVISLAQAVQRDKAAAVGPRAHGADLEARGHALAGDSAAVDRCLGQAAELATGLEGHDDKHPWLYWMSRADMQCKRGISLGFLASDPRYYGLAVAELEAGYAALPADQRSTPWGAEYPAYLAVAHQRAGDVGQACAMALAAARVVQRTGPSLAQRLAQQVHADLQARYPSDPRVAELADALA